MINYGNKWPLCRHFGCLRGIRYRLMAARRSRGLTFFGPRPRTARLFYRSGSLPSDDSETESELCAVAGGPVNWWGQLHAKTLKLTLPARSEGSETVRLIV